MEKHSHVLMVEVSNFNYIFIVGKTIDDTNFKLISQEVISIEYDNENTLRNFELDYYGVSNLDTLKKLIKINNQNVSKIYVFSVTPYHLSLNLLNDNDRKKILFTNNKNEAP